MQDDRIGQRCRRALHILAAVAIGGGAMVASPAAISASSEPPLVWGAAPIEPDDRLRDPSSMVAADLDGDGDIDLATAGAGDGVVPGNIGWHENDGNGNLGAGTVIGSDAFDAEQLIAADLDADGDVDLMYVSRISDKVAWFENDGDGDFGDEQLLDLPHIATSVVAADLDADGDVDLATGGAILVWYSNDGSGVFGGEQIVADDVEGATATIAADLDGDDDLDLAITGFSGDVVTWYRNDGTGTFDPAPLAIASTPDPMTIVDADFDDDGDTDLIISSADGAVTLHSNDGSGVYESTGSLTTVRGASVVAADFDGDGDDDLAASTVGDDGLSWFESAGDGTYGPSLTIDDTSSTEPLAAADFDNDGDIDLTNGVHVYVNSPEPPRVSSSVSPVQPQRFLDTRELGITFDGEFEAGGTRDADTELRVRFGGRGGVPSDAQAVIANVTAVQADRIGFVTAHPCEPELPLASSLNFTTGVNVANQIVLSLDAGDACLYTSASTHLLVDVVGYIGADSPLAAVEPLRHLDTRLDGDTFDDDGAVGLRSAGTTTTVSIAGRGNVPDDATGAIVNLTAVRPEARGYLSAHPCRTDTPNAASLNFTTGITRANELLVDLDADGNVCIFTSATTHLLVDVTGYVLSSDDGAMVPARLLDSRPGGSTIDDQNRDTGYRSGLTKLQIAGRGGVPDDAAAAALYVTSVQPDVPGFVTVGPCVPGEPDVSSLNFQEDGPPGGNEVIVQLDADGAVCIFRSAKTHLTVDVVGHFD